MCTSAFWSSEQSNLVCLEVDITPENRAQLRELEWNEKGFVTTQLRRQRVEVRPRCLSHTEREAFNEAKDREIATGLRTAWLPLWRITGRFRQHLS